MQYFILKIIQFYTFHQIMDYIIIKLRYDFEKNVKGNYEESELIC